MSSQTIGSVIRWEVRPLAESEPVRDAVHRVVESRLPALPVVDGSGKLCGIFGEREFIGALFPGYLDQLSSARFVPRSLDQLLERRSACAHEPVSKYLTRDHIEVRREPSDAEIAEIFLHHRVLIVPCLDEQRRPVAVITRSDFFRALAERFLESTDRSDG